MCSPILALIFSMISVASVMKKQVIVSKRRCTQEPRVEAEMKGLSKN